MNITAHARERMDRISFLTPDKVISDIYYPLNVKYEKVDKNYHITGELARYVIDEDMNIITIMNRRKDEDPEIRKRHHATREFTPVKKTMRKNIIKH